MTTKNLWMKCYISDVDCVDCPYKEQCNISIAALKLFKEKEQTDIKGENNEITTRIL